MQVLVARLRAREDDDDDVTVRISVFALRFLAKPITNFSRENCRELTADGKMLKNSGK